MKHASGRPYPIFNSTHSASSEAASADSSPFESTPDYQGTVVDGAPLQGFFLHSGSPDFQWQLRKWQRYFALKTENRVDRPGSVLSLMLAHSSGVVGSKKPFLLQYNFHAHYQNAAILGIRRTYHLADGGKSENLGMLPLLERGVDTIIVSQMGKEKQDFADPELAKKQAKRLFDCELKLDANRSVGIVEERRFSCPDGRGGNRVGALILIRPTTTNISEFLKDLEETNPAVFAAVQKINSTEDAIDRFPETPTFRKRYPTELIRAYYLLGRYIAMKKLPTGAPTGEIGSTPSN